MSNRRRVELLTDVMARALHYQEHGEPLPFDASYAEVKTEYDTLPQPIIDRYRNDARFKAQVQRAVVMALEAIKMSPDEPGEGR